jgi:hypothetical protein
MTNITFHHFRSVAENRVKKETFNAPGHVHGQRCRSFVDGLLADAGLTEIVARGIESGVMGLRMKAGALGYRTGFTSGTDREGHSTDKAIRRGEVRVIDRQEAVS